MTNATSTHQPQDLSVRSLYLQLAGARVAQIRRGTWQPAEPPEAIAETLMLAAAALAHATLAVAGREDDRARAAIVGFELMGEAFRHDLEAEAFVARALDELDEAPDAASAAFVREAADCLAWAAATLAQHADHAGARRPPLVSMCLVEAADMLAAADRLALRETHTGA